MNAVAKTFVARHRFARLTARKARLAADMIRGMDVNRALETLEFSPRRSSAFSTGTGRRPCRSGLSGAMTGRAAGSMRRWASTARRPSMPSAG